MEVKERITMNPKKLYKEIGAYLFFGIATTVVNYLVYFLLKFFSCDYLISNAIAWFFAVLFAYYTNKTWVFHSEKKTVQVSFKEGVLFFWYRGLSFIIDMGVMILLISVWHQSDFLAKTLTQLIVIVLNYFFSKYFVFSSRTNKK